MLKTLFPALLLGLSLCVQAQAAVSIEADRLSGSLTEGYLAEGNVRLVQDGMLLHADEVRWNPETAQARARGRVWVDDADFFLEGRSLSLDVERRTGIVEQGKVFVREPGYRITGERIEKSGPEEYLIERGTFTLCAGEAPDWKFGARRLEITRGGYARAKHAVFYLHDIPVFYLPYLLYPVKTERESGFLMPSFGFSDTKGFQTSLVYYQVLSRNRDATLYLDHFTRMGLGKGVEYRYIEAMENQGVLDLYHIGGRHDIDDSYAFRLDHRGNLPGRLRLLADTEYVSDKDYFEEFGEVAEEYNKEQVESVLALSRNWGKWNLTAELNYLKDLETNNDATLQRLPRISLDYIRTPIGDGPLYLQFESDSTYFWRREGLRGERLNLRPSILATFRPLSFLEVSPELGYRQRYYWTSREGPGYEASGIYDFSVRTATRVSRVFTLDAGAVEKIQHSIEPEMQYFFVPEQGQEHLPEFDALDRIEDQNRIRLALVNRLTSRLSQVDGQPRYQEFFYYRLSSDYDLRETSRREADHRFSDIRSEIRVTPDSRTLLEVDFSYDPHDRLVTEFDLDAAYTAGADLYLGARLAYERGVQEYAEGRLGIPWLNPFFVHYSHRQDLDEGKRLEDILALEYRDPCWSLFLTLSERPDERKYLLTFSLSEIGEFFRLGGDLGSVRQRPGNY